MNGIEKITERIHADAYTEAEVMRAKAEAECKEIRKKYEEAAQEEYSKLMRRGEEECRQRIQRAQGIAVLEAKKDILATKQEMVAQVFVQAQTVLSSLPEDTYIDFMIRQVVNAAKTGSEELIFNDRDKVSCGEKIVQGANKLLDAQGNLAGKLTLGEESRDMTGGVIVKQGNVETNCSIEILINTYRSELVPQVAAVLFG